MLTESKIAELKAAHGALQLVETPLGDLVFKKPSRAAFDRWLDGVAEGKQSRSALARQLAQDCLVFPDWAGFIAVLDSLPGILNGEVVNACTAECGLSEKYEVKKL